jgi:S-DNA-T family DNA segregation ATPase FtsK/SpoIIIE
VQGEGLTLDNKLDILGVALVLGALALFFSTLSSTKGALTEAINQTLGQALGQGAIAVPVAMMAVGVWLIARHFGEEAPVVAPSRIVGIVIAYLGILVLLQFVETFSYTDVFSLADLGLRLEGSWLYGRGGGYIGGQLYYFLVSNITELGAFFVLVAWLVIGVMLTFDLSMRDLALVTIGTWRSFHDAQQRRGQRVAAKRAELQAQQIAATSAVAIAKPETEQLPAGAEKPALPAPAAAAPVEPPRAIPISMGGRQVATVKGEDFVPAVVAPAAASASQVAAAENKSGVFGRLRGALPVGNRAPAVAPALKEDTKEAPSSGSGLRDRLFSRSSSTAVNPASPGSTPVAPASAAASAASGASTSGSAQSGGVFGQPVGRPGSLPPVGAPGTATPAPASISSPETAQTPAEEAPSRLGDLLRQPAASAAPPTAPYQRPATGQPAAPFGSGGQPASSSTPPSERLNVRPFGAASSPPSPSAAEQRDEKPAASQPQSQAPSASPQPGQASPFSRPPVSVQPAPAAPLEQKPAEKPGEPVSLAERQERLNAIRAGQANRTETTATPPVTRPPVTARPFGQSGSSEPRPTAAPQQSAQTAPSSRSEPAIRSTPPPAPPVMSRSAAHNGQRNRDWKLPDLSTLLNPGSEQEFDRESLLQRARIIEDTLGSFGAPGKVVEVNTGPVITQFAVEPDYLTTRSGKKNRVKVSAIAQLDKDMQLALGAKSIRVEAPVPGKGYVGIEVPNEEASLVSLRDVMEADEFKRIKSPLAISLGMSVDGTPVAADLSSMPHLLIAGTTGSGKSVCVNSIIASIITKNTPKDVKFIMVDPKRVELTGYNGIPHLVAPVVVDLERIVGVLKWVTREMDERYKRFSNAGARNIEDFNKHLPENEEWMPYIIVIIDELADLMMLAPDETERVITRIAALARATGIHLVIATQRPSVDVVTGLIKANFPARIAFAVAGGVDSRVILDQPGAERLLGRGDMLYMSGDSPAPVRLQGVFVSDTEINNITRFWKLQAGEDIQTRPISTLVLDNTLADEPRQVAPTPASSSGTTRQQAFWDRDVDTTDTRSSFTMTESPAGTLGEDEEQDDELYGEAVELVQRLNKASVSLLQRRLRIGYTRAARLIDKMEADGIVGPAESGSKPREVLSSGGGGG